MSNASVVQDGLSARQYTYIISEHITSLLVELLQFSDRGKGEEQHWSVYRIFQKETEVSLVANMVSDLGKPNGLGLYAELTAGKG